MREHRLRNSQICTQYECCGCLYYSIAHGCEYEVKRGVGILVDRRHIATSPSVLWMSSGRSRKANMIAISPNNHLQRNICRSHIGSRITKTPNINFAFITPDDSGGFSSIPESSRGQKQFHESIGSLNDASSSFPILSTLTGNCPTLNSEGVLHGTPGCQLEVRLLIRSEVYFSPLPETGCQNVTVSQQNWFDCVTLYSWYSQPPSSIGLEARKEAGEAVLKAEW